MINSEEQYWDQRYASGGTSGEGSIGSDGEWKWSVIERYVPFLTNVLDIGCGDLTFWEGRDCENYTGIDISKTIVEVNTKKRPKWKFIHGNAEIRIEGLKKDVVFCFDVLFHIMNTKTYREVLKNICHYSNDFIFIYTWINNPFGTKFQIKKFYKSLLKFKGVRALNSFNKIIAKEIITDGKYQYHRSLKDDIKIFKNNDFQLIGVEENPDGVGALYIFRKEPVLLGNF